MGKIERQICREIWRIQTKINNRLRNDNNAKEGALIIIVVIIIINVDIIIITMSSPIRGNCDRFMETTHNFRN